MSICALVGFSHYSSALKERPLLTRVSDVQNNEHFTKFDDMSADYRNAVIATEDHRFYKHGAIDSVGVIRAVCTNILDWKLKEGASTITQQVAKNVVLSQERTWIRKIAEIYAAIDLEKNYSKEEIFELYVNTSYFGDGYTGIYAASNGYYEKLPKDLDLEESAMLAGVPNAPSVYAPTVNPDLATQRQKQVLSKMKKYGYVE